MKPIQVGLLGIGTVGSGTFHVLQRNAQEIQRRAGRGMGGGQPVLDYQVTLLPDNVVTTVTTLTHTQTSLTPGQVYELDIEIWPTCWVFKAGHRMRVEIMSFDGQHHIGHIRQCGGDRH